MDEATFTQRFREISVLYVDALNKLAKEAEPTIGILGDDWLICGPCKGAGCKSCKDKGWRKKPARANQEASADELARFEKIKQLYYEGEGLTPVASSGT